MQKSFPVNSEMHKKTWMLLFSFTAYHMSRVFAELCLSQFCRCVFSFSCAKINNFVVALLQLSLHIGKTAFLGSFENMRTEFKERKNLGRFCIICKICAQSKLGEKNDTKESWRTLHIPIWKGFFQRQKENFGTTFPFPSSSFWEKDFRNLFSLSHVRLEICQFERSENQNPFWMMCHPWSLYNIIKNKRLSISACLLRLSENADVSTPWSPKRNFSGHKTSFKFS